MQANPNFSFQLHETPDIRQVLKDAYKLKTYEFDKEIYGVDTLYANSLLNKRSLFNQPFQFLSSDLSSQYGEKYLDALTTYSVENNLNIVIKTVADLNTENKVLNSVISMLPLIEHGDYATYFKSLKSNFRQNLRTYKTKLQKHGFTLEISNSEKDLKSFHRIMCALYTSKHKMVFQPYGLFLRFFRHETSRFLVARNESGKVCAGIFLLMDGNTVHYNWAASDYRYARFSLNTLLIDFAIQMAYESNFSYFDFGSSPLDDVNLRKFKKKWGTAEHDVYYYYTIKKPLSVNLNSSYGMLRNLYSKLPCFLLRPAMTWVIPPLVH